MAIDKSRALILTHSPYNKAWRVFTVPAVNFAAAASLGGGDTIQDALASIRDGKALALKDGDPTSLSPLERYVVGVKWSTESGRWSVAVGDAKVTNEQIEIAWAVPKFDQAWAAAAAAAA